MGLGSEFQNIAWCGRLATAARPYKLRIYKAPLRGTSPKYQGTSPRHHACWCHQGTSPKTLWELLVEDAVSMAPRRRRLGSCCNPLLPKLTRHARTGKNKLLDS